MVIAGNIVSGFGIVIGLIGCGYWIWFGFAIQKHRSAIMRSRGNWHLIGYLSVNGILADNLGVPESNTK